MHLFGDRVAGTSPHWRSLVVFRYVSLVGVLAQLFHDGRYYRHEAAAWLLLAVVLGWTVLSAWCYPRAARRVRVLLVLDLAVTLSALVAGILVEGPARETIRFTGWWPASVVVAWSLACGWTGGVFAGLCLIAAGATAGAHDSPLAATTLMLLAAFTVGLTDRRRAALEKRLRESMRRETAAVERERMARDIHDTVLQVLALIARRGADLGGAAAELGRLAAGQERVLREAIAAVPPDEPGLGDLRRALGRFADRPGVSVVDSGTPVWLPAATVRELEAAVASALDNVAVHCGPQARAWVLVEAEPDRVRVSIQDDGPGMPPERADQAGVEGRLGIAWSIRGRLRDLGGATHIESRPGQGTRVELSVPAAAR